MNVKKELTHFGVMGMRWGRRKSSSSSDHLTVSRIKKKKVHEMSNEELKVLTSRMQLEKQYKDLKPKKTNMGKKVLEATLGNVGKTAVATITTGVGIYAGKKLLGMILKTG
jgi:hypothetical protein